jgi:hypothetical protein
LGAYLVFGGTQVPQDVRTGSALQPAVASPQIASPASQFQRMEIGQSIDWRADTEFLDVTRQAGPYVLEVSKGGEGESVGPVLKISSGAQSITMTGDLEDAASPNRITLIANRKNAPPVIMLQSYTGGAHCCRHIQLAGFSNGKLKVLDFGSWDGDEIEAPSDISGDGVADFVMPDNRFLYAFASYAESYAPPRIFNIVGGKIIDVSSNPSFRALYAKEMQRAGENCRPGFGSTANGACPSYVAAAARLGKLDEAWSQMLGAYDASVNWQLPSGCAVEVRDGNCPEALRITYKSYPEALQAFLTQSGYIPNNWLPPEKRPVAPASKPVTVDPTTA